MGIILTIKMAREGMDKKEKELKVDLILEMVLFDGDERESDYRKGLLKLSGDLILSLYVELSNKEDGIEITKRS